MPNPLICLLFTIFAQVFAGKKDKDDVDLTTSQTYALQIAICVILAILLATAFCCFCVVGADNIPQPRAEPPGAKPQGKRKKERGREKDEESALDADGVDDDVDAGDD